MTLSRAPLLLAAAVPLLAQSFTKRGFVDFAGIGYPQLTESDSGHAVGEALARYELSTDLGGGFWVTGGIDARWDTHQQTTYSFSWRDRERRRPALAVRRLGLGYSRGKASVELGKQFVSWGRVDFVRPTDRFAPQDYLNLVTTELLPVTAARLTYGSSADSIDFVYLPWITPSRAPLLNQRWAALSSQELTAIAREEPPAIPARPQWGARWSHTGSADYSLCFFDGNDHLPLFDVQPVAADLSRYAARGFYPPIANGGR